MLEKNERDLQGELQKDVRATMTQVLDERGLHPEIAKIKEISLREKIKFPRNKEEYSEELKFIIEKGNEVGEIVKSVNPVDLLTVDDVVRVKKEFLENPTVNPTFTYRNSVQRVTEALGGDVEMVKTKLNKLYEEVREVKVKSNTPEQMVRYVLLKIIRDNLSALGLLEGLRDGDEDKVKLAVQTMYGAELPAETISAAEVVYDGFLRDKNRGKMRGGVVPQSLAQKMADVEESQGIPDCSKEGYEKLQKMRQEDPERAKFYFDSTQIREAFERGLERYYAVYEKKTGEPFPESEKYKVLVTERASSIDVQEKSPEGRRVSIPLYRVVGAARLLYLIDHEIECHARQSLNGDTMDLLGGGFLKVNDETWMEGLALWREEVIAKEMLGAVSDIPSGVEDGTYYIFAEKLACEGKSFVEVFAAVKELRLKMRRAHGYTSAEEEKKAGEKAWLPAYRAFRGHLDTSNVACFASLKDRAYFEGWYLMRQLNQVGLGHLNEMVIPQGKALRLLARLDLTPEDLMFSSESLTRKYYEEEIKPGNV